MNVTQQEVKKLSQWFEAHQRPLPWRQTSDPYKIWLSETMLQQTTSNGVKPFFNKFLEKFPTLRDLALAEEKEVLAAWSGLGYYSRARNLHKCARSLDSLKKFPQRWKDLIKLPGIGPYTARAVSSLAFGEPVGVVDGNVIRVLSRYYNKKWEWWTSSAKKEIQNLADHWAQKNSPRQINQALMELGATICTPSKPFCALCPLLKNCQAVAHKAWKHLPLKKPKKAKELWIWKVTPYRQGHRWALVKNSQFPFLKNQWVFPGSGKKVSTPPKQFHFKHCITHHQIFVQILPLSMKVNGDHWRWVPAKDLPQVNPSSLLKKVMLEFEN